MPQLRRPVAILLLCAASFSAGIAQAACPAPLQSAAYDQKIGGEIDQNLFNSAVLYYTNTVRCQRGLPPFVSTQDVFRAALTQATNMTRTRIYGHTTNVRGARTLRDRMRAQTRNFRAAGENIAKTFVYILNGHPYIPAENCAFRYLDSRLPVPVHSYRSLAQEVVASWEASPEHLANIVNRRYARMGAAFGIDAQGQLCGEVYAVQVFAG
jgi:uncharacterized protein YkwD